jgi:hypothetical protein
MFCTGRMPGKQFGGCEGNLNSSIVEGFLYLHFTKDFLRPIITPYELEVALMAEQSWTGRYVLKFESLLSQHAVHETSCNWIFSVDIVDQD